MKTKSPAKLSDKLTLAIGVLCIAVSFVGSYHVSSDHWYKLPFFLGLFLVGDYAVWKHLRARKAAKRA
ncbi:hypothetical protein [Massilia sp. Leaf139]|uniref:hypothetical protein n=1 Tax=Massilia sp. Leaf139 TaxID=1736272 RepID=UPI0012E96942|nr:hypothetical protein [Massilia sp. Leaf139]